MNRRGLLAFAFTLFLSTGARAETTEAVVTVPAADVWSEPAASSKGLPDEKRETQILFGERVVIHEVRGPWARIEALEQKEYTHHNQWEGYPGWVLATALETHSPGPARWVLDSDWTELWDRRKDPSKDGVFFGGLPPGSALATVHEDPEWLDVSQRGRLGSVPRAKASPAETVRPASVRIDILKTAARFIGTPYLWGGMTQRVPDELRIKPPLGTAAKFGVDCSGLVHLAYRINGKSIPRDAHEQWMKAHHISAEQLLPADLIFSAKADHKDKIVHVVLYAGDQQILEAPQTGMTVRRISFKEKFGKQLPDVHSGDRVGDRVIYFGRLLP